MNFIQRYKLYKNARKEIANSKNTPNYITRVAGDKYSLETDSYDINAELFSWVDFESYTATVKDKQSQQKVEFNGRRGANLYHELFMRAFSTQSR